MIIDLNDPRAPALQVSDVLLVGAGTCGLVLADALRRHGLTVTVLESGPRHPSEQAELLNASVHTARPYRGSTDGRRRCLGGTSLLWGGAMLPFLPHDLSPRPYLNQPGWPIPYEEIAVHIPELERLFGLVEGAYDQSWLPSATATADAVVDDEIFEARFAKWPSFRRRNTASLLSDRLHGDPGLQVVLNATVSALLCDGAAQRSVTAVDFLSNDGRPFRLTAREVVLCAGAIESTRLLLVAAGQHLAPALARLHWLGRGFHDHLSIQVAEVLPNDSRRLNRLAGFRFQGQTMRSYRLELTAAAQARLAVPSAWMHIGFESLAPTGFDALRGIMQRVQKGRLPEPSKLLALLSDVPYLARLGAWRLLRKQLFWPAPARYVVTVVSEQLPRIDNRISLASQRDPLGQPLPSIHWNVSQEDMEPIRQATLQLQAYWHENCEQRIGPLRLLIDPQQPIDPAGTALTDIFHPGGTTRMATQPDDGVVDGQLRVFGIQNLSVLSTSVFPTGASANPTMTLLLLALRLADNLHRRSLAG